MKHLDNSEAAAISLGMAAGHLRQVRDRNMAVERRREPVTLRYLPVPPTPVLQLEHLLCACGWLELAARHKAAQ